MPVEWVGSASGAPDISGASFRSDGDPPLVRLHLWPNRSLPRRGFVAFIGTTFALVLVPLLELDPDLALPDGTRLAECLAALPEGEQRVQLRGTL